MISVEYKHSGYVNQQDIIVAHVQTILRNDNIIMIIW